MPRPSSSSATRLSFVHRRSMLAVSASSTMKVERPPATSSRAPMRTYTASQADIASERAGTSAPTCAITAARHTWRKSVLLPPMFGPVSKVNGGLRDLDVFGSTPSTPSTPSPVRRSAAPPSRTSLGTNAFPAASEPTQGCLSLSARKKGDSPSKPVLSRTSGVQVSAHVAASSSAATASEESASSAAAASAAARHLGHSAQKATVSVRSTPASASSRASSASARSTRRRARSGASKRSKPLRLPSRDQVPGTRDARRSGTSTRCVSLLADANAAASRPPPSVARAPRSHASSASSAAARRASAASTAASAPGLGSTRPEARAASQSKARSKKPSVASSDGIETPPIAASCAAEQECFSECSIRAPASGSSAAPSATPSAPSPAGVTSLKSAGDARRSRVAASKAFAASAAALTASSAARKPRRRSRAASSYSTTCTASRPRPPATLTSRATARSMSGALRMSARARPIASSPAPRRSATASWRALTAAALRSGRVTHWRSSLRPPALAQRSSVCSSEPATPPPESSRISRPASAAASRCTKPPCAQRAASRGPGSLSTRPSGTKSSSSMASRRYRVIAPNAPSAASR